VAVHIGKQEVQGPQRVRPSSVLSGDIHFEIVRLDSIL